MEHPTVRPAYLVVVASLLIQAVPAPSWSENIDPANSGSKYAYSENVGWLNARPLGSGGPGIDVQDFQLIGWMWGENIGWVSLSCLNTGTCGTVNYGVANDGFGHLSGFAWAENAGWINFSPATGGVIIDPVSGNFSGAAWGENVGWIIFSALNPVAYRVQTSWCQGTSAPPGGIAGLSVIPSGTSTQLSWSSLPDSGWYDVVFGDLSALVNSGGNFAAATQGCLGNDLTTTSSSSSSTPAVGHGYWFVVRGENCRGNGTYDEGGAQVGFRDPGINSASLACH